MTQEIELGGVPETLLVPLFYRAKETRGETPLIKDHKAVEIVDQIDYDFSRCTKWLTQACVIVRTQLFQNVIRQFLETFPDSVVINLAAGLDNRFNEMDNGRVRWFDLDLPNVIEIRQRYFTESDRNRFVGADALDHSWMDKLGLEDPNVPILVIAEGLFPYLPEMECRKLLTALADRFPNSRVLLEIFGSFIIGREWLVPEFKHIKPFPKFLWSPQDPYTLETWDSRFKTLSVENLFDHHDQRWRFLRLLFRSSSRVRNMFGSRVVSLDLNAQPG